MCVCVYVCVCVFCQRALVGLMWCVRAHNGVDVLYLIGVHGCWCVMGLRVVVCCVFVVSVGC